MRYKQTLAPPFSTLEAMSSPSEHTPLAASSTSTRPAPPSRSFVLDAGDPPVLLWAFYPQLFACFILDFLATKNPDGVWRKDAASSSLEGMHRVY